MSEGRVVLVALCVFAVAILIGILKATGTI